MDACTTKCFTLPVWMPVWKGGLSLLYIFTVWNLIDFPRYNMKCSGENVILHGKVLVLYYQISLYISCYISKNLECFSNRVDACLEKAVLSLYGCVPGKGCTLFLWMRAWKRLYSLFMDACMEKLSTFSRKNEITIPSLQYRKAKELKVRLYGFCENAFTWRYWYWCIRP